MLKLGESKITETAITGFCLQAFILFTPMQEWLSLTMPQMQAASGMLGMLIFAVIGMLRKRQKIKIKTVKTLASGQKIESYHGEMERELVKPMIDIAKGLALKEKAKEVVKNDN